MECSKRKSKALEISPLYIHGRGLERRISSTQIAAFRSRQILRKRLISKHFKL